MISGVRKFRNFTVEIICLQFDLVVLKPAIGNFRYSMYWYDTLKSTKLLHRLISICAFLCHKLKTGFLMSWLDLELIP